MSRKAQCLYCIHFDVRHESGCATCGYDGAAFICDKQERGVTRSNLLEKHDCEYFERVKDDDPVMGQTR